MKPRRWDPCIANHGEEVGAFVTSYFGQADRRILLIGAAGFDPRSQAVAALIAPSGGSLQAMFIQENRPNPPKGQIELAAANAAALALVVPSHTLVPIDIFGSDNAVVGGRNVLSVLHAQPLHTFTDVIVDLSALSVGTSFPMVRYLVERVSRKRGPANLHVFVAHDPGLDAAIRSTPSDAPGHVHGFRGGSTLDRYAGAARLWLPQLAAGRRAALGRLFDFVAPHDTCPILPFPAHHPRLGDALAEEYLTELESTWAVDTRNIVYADEADPIDLYRTILRLDDLRQPVFAETGGSLLVLSPLGSKVMALGALMAALERDLPVAHLEPISYEMGPSISGQISQPSLIHVWLEGDVYPEPRPALSTEERPAS